MTIENAVALGVLQGLTEFLPVSSSGHLVVMPHLMPRLFGGASPPLAFDVLVHVGTLVAAVAFMRTDVWQVIRGAWRLGKAPGRWRVLWRDDPWVRLVALIALSTLVTAVIGLAGGEVFEPLFEAPRVACVGLLVTAALLFASHGLRREGNAVVEAHNMPVVTALLVGLAQGVAITPGISRSGSTMCSGLLAGVSRDSAFRYAFLLMIPAVALAALKHVTEGGIGGIDAAMALGAIASAVVGFAALAALRVLVVRGHLWVFAVYCVALALYGLARI
ncbi:MAG TPA: undecaprenyl-diphosphate phosphatase [Armatimonadota bacterium]|nr:undecaprenyl-diphosphate phosphatase [Armatimonadota bacterium]HQK95350.1 undecaprenyl-diphosphate phosphatase [Armatimonadota bacterium]